MKKILFFILMLCASNAFAVESTKFNIFSPAHWYNWGCNSNGLSNAIDTSSKKFEMAFISPDTFTLNKVVIQVHSVTGTPVAYDVRVETDSSGNPSGTLAWTNSSGQLASGATSGYKEITLTATGSITAGTKYHVVVQPASDPASANYINIATDGCGIDYLNISGQAYNGSSWSGGNGGILGLISNDGTPLMVARLVHEADSANYLSNTDWRGFKVTMADTVTMVGGGFDTKGLLAGSTGTLSIYVIDTSNNILASGSVNGKNSYTVFLSTPYQLVKGTTYRIVFQDSSGALRLRGYVHKSTYTDGDAMRDWISTVGTSSDGIASPTSWSDTVGVHEAFYLFGSTSVEAGAGTFNIYGATINGVTID